VEGTSQAVLGSSDQRKVPASLSLFLKSEKIPALLYIGKGPKYRPFCDLGSVPEAQIREGPILRLFPYNSRMTRKIGKNYLSKIT
jgi:hypothetical protein